MNLPLALRRRARLDLLDAILWHDDQRTGLGDELEAAVDAALETISERPKSFPAVGGGARRALTKQFSYAIYFKQEADAIIVFAILHTSRSSREWKRRLKD